MAISFDLLEIFDSNKDVESVSVELRMPEGRWHLQPMLGVTLPEDDSVYFYGGSRLNLDLGRSWRISPGFAAGIFEPGELLDLGFELEFRSSIELSVGLGARGRLGVELYHLSNGSLADSNPGTDGVVLRYMHAIP